MAHLSDNTQESDAPIFTLLLTRRPFTIHPSTWYLPGIFV